MCFLKLIEKTLATSWNFFSNLSQWWYERSKKGQTYSKNPTTLFYIRVSCPFASKYFFHTNEFLNEAFCNQLGISPIHHIFLLIFIE
jgi:hypothetical protein